MSLCSIPGCGGKLRARGWCQKHWKRWRKHGDPEHAPPSDSDRFFQNITVDNSVNPCWLWTGTLDKDGYGQFSARATLAAHRWSYEYLRAPIPDGLVIDHLCRVHACVNPWHMDPVPGGVNTTRGFGISTINRLKAKCINGHSLSGDNLYADPRGRRGCRACRATAVRKFLNKGD